MLKSSLLWLCLSVLCVSQACAMQCVVRRVSSPVCRVQKKAVSTCAVDLYTAIKEIGLTKCLDAYESG